MKYLPSFVILALSLVIILLPDFAFAQDVVDKSATPGGLIPCQGADCTTCHVVQLGKNILNWLIGVLTIVFALMAAWAGFGLVTSGGNQAAKSAAKSMMTNALIGFLIVLAGWLIVDTLLRGFLSEGDGKLDGRFWSEIQCLGQTPTNKAPDRPVISSGVPSSCEVIDIEGDQTIYDCDEELSPEQLPRGCKLDDKWLQGLRDYTWTCPDVEPDPPTGGKSEGYVLSKFSANGITFSSTGNNCTDKNRRNCTGLDGMQEKTVDNIIELKKNCNCRINVTGGTEVGHAEGEMSHSTGYKYDVSLNPELEAYIKSIPGVVRGTRGSDTTYTAPDGTVYAKEGNHWDILVK